MCIYGNAYIYLGFGESIPLFLVIFLEKDKALSYAYCEDWLIKAVLGVIFI